MESRASSQGSYDFRAPRVVMQDAEKCNTRELHATVLCFASGVAAVTK